MGSKEKRPHVLCIPAPAQGHINPMLKLAKILHSNGFLITFVNTEINHQRFLSSQGSDALHSFPSFCFEAIPDGLLSPHKSDVTEEVVSLFKSMDETCLRPFKSLLTKLSASSSPITFIVADFFMGFTLDAAREFDIPEMLLWTSGAGSLICFQEYYKLLKRGLIPPTRKDSSFVNGFLDTMVDCIPSMSGMRMKDMPSFLANTSPGDQFMVQFVCLQVERAKTASAILFNTFHELDCDLDILHSLFPPCYGIGPLNLIEKNIADHPIASIKSNLRKEEHNCLKWLESKPKSSVIYVNFGTSTVMTHELLVEFCWGLANSKYSFLWIISQDLVVCNSGSALPPDFLEETNSRGLLASWCPQEKVLNHPAIGGFLTHSGWNSTLESISGGVPMICWPFFADQQTNCWSCCNKWGVAMEIDNNVKREEVAKLVIELMNGEKGDEMRKNAIDLKNKAEKACAFPFGSSIVNLEKVVHLIQTFKT